LSANKLARTEEALDAVWTEEDGQSLRKGVLAYALFTDPERQSAPFPLEVWPAGTRFDTDRFTDKDDRSYAVILWTILPGSWPEPKRWLPTLESTLHALSDGDAVVAWCALEPGLGLPPKLFDPDLMPDEVYAALIPGRFACSAQLGKVYEPLSRAVMTEFMNATNQRFAAQRTRSG
jgi:hypothetical protein